MLDNKVKEFKQSCAFRLIKKLINRKILLLKVIVCKSLKPARQAKVNIDRWIIPLLSSDQQAFGRLRLGCLMIFV